MTKTSFIHMIAGLKSNEFMKVPCSCGATIKIEKAKYPFLNMYYFKKGSIQPNKVSTTDFDTMKHVVLNSA